MNLLIVDDTPTDLKLLRAQLEAEGQAVFEAHDGVDALALLERQRVDGVISDILMPRMDGYRLCHEIRKHARLHDLPIIIYTATFTSPSDEKLALDVGADKYLKKPASVETIITALHEVIAMPHAAPRPEALQEVEVLKAYSERLVFKLEKRNTELMAAEVKFRALVVQSIAGMCIIQDDQFVYVNPRMAGIFGRSEEEMTSRTIYDFIVPEDHALVRENIRKRISGEVPSLHYYLRILHQSGAVLQVEVYGSRADYNGRPAVMGTLLDITERKQAEEALAARADQQAVVAELGRLALAGADLQQLFDQGTTRVAETFGTEYCKVLELLPDGSALKLVAGVGWKEGLVGQATVGADRYSQAGFTLLSRHPVIVEDLRTETRFSGPPLLRDHGIVSGLSVIIGEVEEPFGVMGVHTTRRRVFTSDDVNFFQSVAHVLAEAIQRKRAEAALRESEARTRLLVKSSNIGLWDWNLVTNDVFFSTEWKSQLGHADDEVPGRYEEWESRLHPEDREPSLRAVQDFREGRRADYDVEFRLRHKDGSYRWILTQAQVFPDASNKPVRMMGCHIDITERKHAEEELLASERRYRDIFTFAPVGIYQSLRDGALITANKALAEMLGYASVDELLRVELGSGIYFAEDEREKLIREYEGLGYAVDLDMQWKRKDGSPICVQLSAHAIKGPNGETEYFEGFVRDITERKRAEQKILAQLDELRRWQEVTLGREDRVLELKREVNELGQRLGEPARYASQTQP